MKIEIRNDGEIHVSGYVNAVERKLEAAACSACCGKGTGSA